MNKWSTTNDLLYLASLAVQGLQVQADEVCEFVGKSLFDLSDRTVSFVPLKNVFATFKKNGKEPLFFAPAEYGSKIENRPSVSQQAVDGMVKKLVEELPKKLGSPVLLERLLKKYLSFVAFSAPFDDSVSAYQYSRLFALVCSNLRSYLEATGKSVQHLSSAEESLLLVGGDISGIQKFISNVSSKGALRSYRGRSFFIELIQEVVVDQILESAGASRLSMYFIGGGHFYLVLPNTESVKRKFNEKVEEINRWFIEHRLDLSVVIDSVPLSLEEVKGRFQDKMSELSKKLRLKKLRGLSPSNMPSAFEPLKLAGLEVCKICGRKVQKLYKLADRSDEERIACDLCRLQYVLGKGIMDKSNVYIAEMGESGAQGGLVKPSEESFEILGRVYTFADKITAGQRGYKIRKTDEINDGEVNVVAVDLVTYAYDQELSELVRDVPGKRFAALQADVDNLGRFFRERMSGTNLAVSSTVSSMLTYFFKVQLNHILEEKRLVVVYAGGDDLFAIGSWKDMLKFAKELNDAFRSFVANELVTLSAGYLLFDGDESIRSIKSSLEEVESMAKSGGKDSIAFSNAYRREFERGATSVQSGLSLKWSEFEQVYDLFMRLGDLAEYVDRSLIRKVLTISYEGSPLAHAFFSYLLAREVSETDSAFLSILIGHYEGLKEAELSRMNAKINLVSQFLDLLARRQVV